jgi:hypothetical protein
MSSWSIIIFIGGIVVLGIDYYHDKKAGKNVALALILVFQLIDSCNKDSTSEKEKKANKIELAYRDSLSKADLHYQLQNAQTIYADSLRSQSNGYTKLLDSSVTNILKTFEEERRANDRNAKLLFGKTDDLKQKIDSSKLKGPYIGYIANPTNAVTVTYDSASKKNTIITNIQNFGDLIAYNIIYDRYIIIEVGELIYIKSDTATYMGNGIGGIQKFDASYIWGEDYSKKADVTCIIQGKFYTDEKLTNQKSFEICAFKRKDGAGSNLCYKPELLAKAKKSGISIK